MNAIDKRMFYLMLSVQEGQYYAQSMGFPPPSEEVQEIEQATDWFADFLEHFDKLGSNSEEFRDIMAVFGVALTNKLIDSEKVIPVLDGIFMMEQEDE